jgi:hypothetical protein
MGGRTDAYRVLLGKHEVKRPLGRPRSGWKENIKKIFRE